MTDGHWHRNEHSAFLLGIHVASMAPMTISLPILYKLLYSRACWFSLNNLAYSVVEAVIRAFVSFTLYTFILRCAPTRHIKEQNKHVLRHRRIPPAAPKSNNGITGIGYILWPHPTPRGLWCQLQSWATLRWNYFTFLYISVCMHACNSSNTSTLSYKWIL